MRNSQPVFLLTMFLVLFTYQSLFADPGMDQDMKTQAMPVMAGIMLGLNHHPSSNEKEKLRKIIDNKSVPQSQRTLANAMLNLNHSVSSADKPKLQKIIDDKSLPENERNMADILFNISHKPTGSDKEKLRKILN